MLNHLDDDMYACPKCGKPVSIATANGICIHCNILVWPDGQWHPLSAAEIDAVVEYAVSGGKRILLKDAPRPTPAAPATPDQPTEPAGIPNDKPINPPERRTAMPEERMLKWFEYADHPDQETSARFWDIACQLAATVEIGPERTVAFRKLLEAKDAAVRAKLNPGG